MNTDEPNEALSFLKDFTRELASVRTRKQLAHILDSELAPFFNHFRSTIFLLDKEHAQLENFSNDFTKVDPSCTFQNSVSLQKPVVEDQLKRLSLLNRDTKAPDFILLTEEKEIWPYLIYGEALNTMSGILFSLRRGSEILGHWLIISDNKTTIGERQLSSLQVIRNHIALTVGNILANEELARFKDQREIIQALNVDFSSARDKDLLSVIHSKLSKLFEFSHCFVCLVNEDDVTATFFLGDSHSTSKSHPMFREVTSARYAIMDGVFNKVLLLRGPVIFDVEQYALKGEMPPYMQMAYESGVTSMILTMLYAGSKTIGQWGICQTAGQKVTSGQLDLIRTVAVQLSIAVDNIRSSEIIRLRIAETEQLLKVIAQREKERELLYALHTNFTAIRNKHELIKVIDEDLKEVLGFRQTFILRVCQADNATGEPLFVPLWSGQEGTARELWDNKSWPVIDEIIKQSYATNDPLIFDLDSLHKKYKLPGYLQAHYQNGITHIMLIRLLSNNTPLGCWFLLFSDPGTANAVAGNIVRSLANQIAVIMQNIITNEKITEREIEKRHLMGFRLDSAVSGMLAKEKTVAHLEEVDYYKSRLEDENIYLKEEIEITHNYAEIVGESPEMQKVFKLIAQVAPSDSTVLILGETGTGKELAARAIHDNSPRKDKLMVKVNCAALPANLIESELFGHERGSFTGATERRLGKFELAHGGTLFLDEIGELPLELQVKLLRALQEKEIERIGGKSAIKVDVRIIAATNRDLEKEMEEGTFRKDLYYRLNIFPIYLPALRERKEDIPLLARYFISRFAKKTGKKINTLGSTALHDLLRYSWPGNVREMEHFIERSILLTTGDTLQQVDLPANGIAATGHKPVEEAVIKTIDENERDHILKALRSCNGKISGPKGAARLLGVPASTLNSKMKKLGIKKEHIALNGL